MPRPYNLPPERSTVRSLNLLLLAIGLFSSGCATHIQSLGSVRYPLYAGDVPRAAAAFDAKKPKQGDLLWLLEKAHLCHMNGQWGESSVYFELAERKADELYTRSVSKGIASLVTTDKILPYSSPLHEMTLIPYYRALNYLHLGQTDEALVEARKSAFNLSRLSEKDAGKNLRPMAFLNYVTGLLFASRGQWDDALVSLRAAYRLYSRVPGSMPASLPADYYLAARKLGMESELADARAKDPDLPKRAALEEKRNVVIFIESGFVPYRNEFTVTLPLLESKPGEGPDRLSRRYVDSFGSSLFSYRHTEVTLKQVLQFAFPFLQDFPLRAESSEAGLSGGTLKSASPALELSPVAHEQFGRDLPGILSKTVARAIAKELARHQAKKQGGDLLGWAVNLLNITTEQADTRSWLLLPARYEVVKLTVPEGKPVTLTARTLTGRRNIIEEKTVPVTLKPGEKKWMSFRFFQ